MLPPFGNPLWPQDGCGAQQQQQDAPPPTPMMLGATQPLGHEPQQNLLSLAQASADLRGGVFSAPPVVDDEWYFNSAAGAGAQGSLLLAPPGEGAPLPPSLPLWKSQGACLLCALVARLACEQVVHRGERPPLKPR